MKCVILTTDEELATNEEVMTLHTLDEIGEVITKMDGSAQIWVYPDRWVIEDFRKLLPKEK